MTPDKPLLDVPHNRQFVCMLHWLGFAHLSCGLHVHWPSPNIEIHLPFCFIRLGWQGIYRWGQNPYRTFGKQHGELK